MTFDAVQVGDTFIDSNSLFSIRRRIVEVHCGTDGKTLVRADNDMLYYVDNSEVQ